MSLLGKLFRREASNNKIIFIVEDNLVYGKLLEEFLRQKLSDINDIKTYHTGEDCLKEIQLKPSVVIMDHILDINGLAKTGLEVIKEIKEFVPATNIIVLSSQTNIDVTVESIKKYNCHYIKKDDRALEKVAAFIKGLWKTK
jgi:ActR/RegA family two-component response regulator